MNNILDEEALFELLTLDCETNKYGTKIYRNKEKQVHRMYGPAIIYKNGYESWYKNGKYHREDGPAVIYPHGTVVYYINGRELSKYDFIYWQIEHGIKPIK